MSKSTPVNLQNLSGLNPTQDIAIVGMACRFADAPNTDTFWQNILHGRECFSNIPRNRWDNEAFYSQVPRQLDKSYVQKGAFIENVRDFAAMHYGIAPKRVQAMDPQHRLLMDTVRAALQDAGLERFDFETGAENSAGFNPSRMGTFLGLSSSEYRDILGMRTMALAMASGVWGTKPDTQALKPLLDSVENLAPLSAFSMPGTLLNMAAASIAHQWGLGGPAFSIDAACASALVAVTDAVTYLRAGLCDSAVAGGAYLNLTPLNLVCFSRIGAISKQGRCRPFDAAADGFLQGDGSGIIVLKRLETALEDGDRIHSVIRGVGINNDGNLSPGPMAPSPKGQLLAIRNAHADSKVDPATIEFVECHGTATPVGDPVEVASLAKSLEGGATPDNVWISSVKANVGHTMSAAGIAGLIKAVLVMKHGVIPPQAAFESVHPKLQLEGTPFSIATSAQEWKRGAEPRRSGVSSFGFGGTNCHVVLEEAIAAPQRKSVYVSGWTERIEPAHVFVVTAPTLELLAEHSEGLAAGLTSGIASRAELFDIAATLNTTRRFERFRATLVAASTGDLVEQLGELTKSIRGGAQPGILGPDLVLADSQAKQTQPCIAWMFPGQGAQRVGLLRGLYERFPVFAKGLDALASEVNPILPKPLLSYVYPNLGQAPELLVKAEEELKATEICQPAMAALGLAFGGFLESLGLAAQVTLGHSLGEFAAAATGGMLKSGDALRFVAARGQLMANLELDDCGAMAAAMAGQEETLAVIESIEDVQIANINHPRQTVVSGTTPAVNLAVQALKAAKVAAKPLRVSHAFHSPVVAPVGRSVDKLITELDIQPPVKTVVSAISAKPYSLEDGGDSARSVFSRHATAPVDFVGCLESAVDAGANIFLEVGAGKTLTSFAKGTLGERARVFQMHDSKHDGERTLMRALGQLSCDCEIQWQALYPQNTFRVVTLPETLLETEPYWVVQERKIPLVPANVAKEELVTLNSLPVSSSHSQANVMALFQEQTKILATHANILAQQTAILSGEKLPLSGAMLEGAEIAASPAFAAGESVGESLDAPATSTDSSIEAPLVEWTMDSVLPIVSELVSDVSAFPASALKPSQRLAADLGFDSLMFVELSSKIDSRFEKVDGGIPQSLMSDQASIDDIAVFLVDALNSEVDAVADKSAEATLGCFAPVVVERPIPLLPIAADRLGDLVLITRDSHGVADATALALKDLGQQVVLIDPSGTPGEKTGPLGEDILHWQLNPASVDALFETLAKHQLVPDAIVHCAALDATFHALESAGSACAVSNQVAVAHKLAAGLHRVAQGGPRAFATITGLGGKFGLSNSDVPANALSQVGLVGFTKALAREWPDAWVKTIDVNPSAKQLGLEITAELFCADAAVEVGLENGVRYAVALEPRALQQTAGTPPSANDVILITGGGKGLGAKTAQHLVQKYGCCVVLSGRSHVAEGSETQELLNAIQSMGGRATYFVWDVQTPLSADQIEQATVFGPITGLIHCAGVIRDKRVQQKPAADIRAVFNTKAAGLLHGIHGFDSDSLRFIIGYSSWSGRFGNIGQTDYSAANEWLNRALTLTEAKRETIKATSIMWPPWEDSAMARTIPATIRKGMEASGVRFLSDEEGLGLLDQILAGGLTGEVLAGGRVPLETRSLATSDTISTLTHPYLEDHRLKGEPVMPLAVALDTAMQVLSEVDANAQLPTVSNLTLFKGVVVADPLILESKCDAEQFNDENGFAGTWELKQVNDADAQLSYRAQLTTHSTWAEDSRFETAPGALTELPFTLDDFYAERTFHGPLLRGIEGITAMDSQGIQGVVRTSQPTDWIPMSMLQSWAVDPLVLDGSFQLVAYWLWHFHEKSAFPVGFGRFVKVAEFPTSPVHVQVVAGAVQADTFTGSIRYTDSSGNLLAVLEDVVAQVFFSQEQQAPSTSANPAVDIDASHYRVEAFPEVREFSQRLKSTEAMGLKNPFFVMHGGTARDVSTIEGREMINFSSYNYLGYSGHPQVVKAAQDAIAQYGTSVSASRVASGERPLHRQLESELSSLLDVESSLIFSSGHHTNETVIGHLFGEKDLIVHDSLAHNSIMQGAIMSGAKRRPFHHGDWEELDKILSQLRSHFEKCVIAIEGVYSMDGDIANLPKFIEMRDKYKCLLFVDEAHSAGILGHGGGGIREHFGTRGDEVDIWMGTLSKSFASCGGYVGGSAALIEYLKYTTPGFVFSAGISPANSAAALEAIRLMKREPENVKRLQDRSAFFLSALQAHGIDTGMSDGSAVIPCIVGNSMKCLQLSEQLRVRGINVQPIVYPAVDEDAARLRFFISSLHSEQQLQFTADVLARELLALTNSHELRT